MSITVFLTKKLRFYMYIDRFVLTSARCFKPQKEINNTRTLTSNSNDAVLDYKQNIQKLESKKKYVTK